MSAPALIILAIWLFFSGTGGFGYQTLDYRASNALLKDLIVQDWPLTAQIREVETSIVYYVGYCLPAALVGKTSGWTAANVFIFLWTSVGIALSCVWFWKICAVDLKKRKRRVLALSLLFCLSGGLDFVGYHVFRGNAFDLTAHIEWWVYYFQYSSNTTLIYWVPQQTIAAWLLTGIVVSSICEPTNLKCLGVSIASAIIWSPFGVVGIVPYLLIIPIVYLRQGNRRHLSIQNRFSSTLRPCGLYRSISSIWHRTSSTSPWGSFGNSPAARPFWSGDFSLSICSSLLLFSF